ncbi:MAG: beta-lactamase family protein [Saprospiraceae bacterium]|nr:beta-lactamase family protein [Saprospiraceae bacterium]
MKTIIYRLWLVLLLFYSPTILQGQWEQLSKDLAQQLDAIFEDYKEDPGCALGIFHKGKIVYQKGYGYANLDYGVKVTPETIFETASISKQFTAACILHLEDQGKISLDDDIHKYFPELPRYKEGTITIRQLLHHTSGLRDYLILLQVMGNSWDMTYNNDQGFALLTRQQQLCFTPGTKYGYSNSGYLLLAEIIERKSGKSLAQYAKEHLFDPLGMKNTFIYQNAKKVVKNRAVGYVPGAEGFEREHYYNFISEGDGGVQTNIVDFFKWSENLKSNQLSIKNFQARMLQRGRLNNGDTIPYALGLEHAVHMGSNLYAHNGMWGGNRSMFLQFPKEDLSIITLSNNGGQNVWQKAYQVASVLLEDGRTSTDSAASSSYSPPATIVLSPKKLSQFCKDYFDFDSGLSRRIYLKNDTLQYQRGPGNESPLWPISENEFIMGNVGTDLRITFETNPTEGKVMWVKVNLGTTYKHVAYEKPNYSQKDWASFTGSFYSPELNTQYEISHRDGQLELSTDGEVFARWSPAMKNTFRDDHFGYITFDPSRNAFVLTEESVGKLQFTRGKI